MILKTWVKVLFKPSEKVFAAERGKASATLAVALGWIIFANALVTLIELGQGKLEWWQWGERLLTRALQRKMRVGMIM